MDVTIDAEELAELRLRAKRDRRRERNRELRRSRLVDEEKYSAFVVRAAKAFVEHSTEGGITSLELLSKLSSDVDEVIATLVTYLRSAEGGAYSWSAVGKALGITKARAIQRYGTGEGARKRGGQPAHLRR